MLLVFYLEQLLVDIEEDDLQKIEIGKILKNMKRKQGFDELYVVVSEFL